MNSEVTLSLKLNVYVSPKKTVLDFDKAST